MPSLSLTSTIVRPVPRNAERNPTSRSPSPRNTVRLSVMSTSEGAEPSHSRIRYAAVTPGAVVVDAHVCAARTDGTSVAYVTTGTPAVDEAIDGLGDRGFVLRLEHHAVAAADAAQRLDHLLCRPRLPQMEPGPQHGRCERGQFGLDRGPEGVGESLRGLHDDVDEVAAAVEAQLGALLVQVGDRLHRPRPWCSPAPRAVR